MVAPCHEQFQFGDGNVEIACKKYFYPVFIKGEYRGILDQASVPVNCPQLLSKMVMRKWDVDLCFGSEKTRINKFNVELPFSSSQVPIVNIFDVSTEQLASEWKKIPVYFKLDHVNTTSDNFKIEADKKERFFVWQNGRKVYPKLKPQQVSVAEIVEE